MDMITSNYIVIDIETGHAPGEAIEKACESWEPPKNIKDPKKIEERRQDKMKDIKQKSALLDAAPIICICIKPEGDGIAFNGMSSDRFQIPGWITIGCEDEKSMLIGLREWLNKNTDSNTILVGHNIRGFDKPKLRNRYLNHRLRLPLCLEFSMNDTTDTMSLASHVSVQNKDQFVGLGKLCDSLNIEQPKQNFSGKEVPDAHERGEYELIINYCAMDVMSTEKAYLMMMGFAMELE